MKTRLNSIGFYVVFTKETNETISNQRYYGSLKVSGKPDKQDSIKIVSITLIHDTR